MADQTYIGLLGETGSGKSTFVNRAIGEDVFLVGTGLRSCTSEIQVSSRITVDGHPVFLVDTPGFNDTVMDDADALKKISSFFEVMYKSDVKLAGVIYFHRISDERWRKSDTRSFGWLKRICGERTLRNVVLMTNMWDKEDPAVGAARERQLAVEFVKPALDNGAQLLRHYNTTESAHNIIRAILKNHQTVLQVQQELVDEMREFDRTTVGEELNREIEESMEGFQRRLEELQNDLAAARRRGGERTSELETEITGLQEEIERRAQVSGNMNADYGDKRVKAGRRWTYLRWSAGAIAIGGILLRAAWLLIF